MLCWGLLGNFFIWSAGVQEHKNALTFSAWEVSVPSGSKRKNTACSTIIQMSCERSCGSFWDDPTCDHKAVKCPRPPCPPPETGASPNHSEVLHSSHSLGLWSRKWDEEAHHPQRSRSPWAQGVFRCVSAAKKPCSSVGDGFPNNSS